MKTVPKLSAAILAATTLALLCVVAIYNNPPYHATAMDRRPELPPAHPSSGLAATGQTAYFVVGFPPEDWTFTIMLTDTTRIQEARDIINGVETEKVSVIGTIVKAPVFYNPPWSYHLDPATIEFFEAAVEVCDAHPLYVEEHLQEACGAFLPNCVWCPFTSVVVAEVQQFEQFLPLVAR